MVKEFVCKCLMRLGFLNLYYPMVWGDRGRLHLGRDVVPVNTLFNTMSGEITVGEGTFFGHNCMVLTGKHLLGQKDAVPSDGYSVYIGKRCWIASGAIILGNVIIGDSCIIAAGSIVTKDVPSGETVKGVW